ncbi:THO complex subunit 3 [Clonorchis sinensis]|uniref:THO complex subunit 3 n=1 Tax=Clonorchis sinensis TaxID=79923 RepID=A0A3R7CX44_CLOSI|nr:THO complex subunit 3 [Clonorchis sinensis]
MGSDDLIRVRSHFLRHSRVKEFSGYGGKIHTLAWNVTGSRLASGSSDKLVNLYALDSSKLVKVHTFRGHNESVDQLCWHPSDPELLATVGADGAVRLWDCRSKKDPITAQLKGENINLAWSSDARCIAVGNKTDLISWLDVRAGLKPIQSEQFNFEINEFAWKPNTDIFLLTTGLGSILVYSGKPGDMRRETSLQAHPVNAMCLQFTNSGRYFAVGRRRSCFHLGCRRVRLYSNPVANLIYVQKVRGSNPTFASQLPLSSLGQPGSISALMLPSGGMAARHRKGVSQLNSCYYSVRSMEIRGLGSPDESQEGLVTYEYDRMNDQRFPLLKSPLEWPVRTLGFTHDAKLLAAASEDHFIDIGHVETGEQVFQVGIHSSATFVLCWHPKQYLLTYSSEAKYEREQGVIRLFGFPSDSIRTSFSLRLGVNFKKSFSCNTLSVPSCHAARKKHEGWHNARLIKPRREVEMQRSGSNHGTSAVTPFRCLTAMPLEGCTRAGILPRCPNLDRASREAAVGFEPRTFRSVNSRSNHLGHLAQINLVLRDSLGTQLNLSCSTLSVPNCHATRKKHEGWDTARLTKAR